MTTRAAIVAEARTWLEPVTVFRHQAHKKGLASDCIGMIGSVGIAVGSFPPDAWQTMFSKHEGYGRSPSKGTLAEVCRKFLIPIAIEAAQVADVVLMRFKLEPQHVGFLVPYDLGGMALIHAYIRAGKVVEHRLDDKWRDRVVEAFALPGVTE